MNKPCEQCSDGALDKSRLTPIKIAHARNSAEKPIQVFVRNVDALASTPSIFVYKVRGTPASFRICVKTDTPARLSSCRVDLQCLGGYQQRGQCDFSRHADLEI